jgi:hypothetical protein
VKVSDDLLVLVNEEEVNERAGWEKREVESEEVSAPVKES